MLRSLDHSQGATLFLAKVTSKTFIKFLYINRVLWQHVVLCKIALLGMLPGAFPLTHSYTTRHAATTPVNIKEFYECF